MDLHMPQRSGADEAMRHELVSIAIKLHDEHGADLPLRQVWETAGIGHGKFKRLFPSREALVAEIVSQEFESLLEWSRSPPPEEVENGALVGWLNELTTTLLNDPGLPGLLLTAYRRPGTPLHHMSIAIADITYRFVKEHVGASPRKFEIDIDQVHIAVLAAISASEKLFPGRWEKMLGDRFASVNDQLWSIRFALDRCG